MQKGWKQTWKDVLLQHFEINDSKFLQKLLPKECTLDSYEGKYYLGLVSMKMTNVRHKMTREFVWFKSYNELNVRAYITYKGEPGVLFLTLDVDSLISMLGARLLYGLPYRYRNFNLKNNYFESRKADKITLTYNYTIEQEKRIYSKDSFAFWATERYFFVNKYLGKSFIGRISHQPWQLSLADVTNHNLEILKEYPLGSRHPEILFCSALEITTSPLHLI